MRQRTTRPFLAALSGAVLAGAVLIVLVPGFFDTAGPSVPVAVTVALAVLAVVCGAAARSLRPDRPDPTR